MKDKRSSKVGLRFFSSTVMDKFKIDELPKEGGSYALFFRLKEDAQIEVGKLGVNAFKEGLYVYVGSAFGPGGVRARVGRHIAKTKIKRWHLDYLRPVLDFEAGYFVIAKNLECAWSKGIIKMEGVSVPVTKMGASDCKSGCKTHFYQLAASISLAQFEETLKAIAGEAVHRI